MSIRPAKAADVMDLIRLVEAAHARTVYAGRGEVDRDVARQFFARAVHMHGHSRAGATLFFVSVRDGRIEGYGLFGLDRVYQVGRQLCAGDVHFYCTDNAEHGDAHAMFEAFVEWAEKNPNVIEIAVSDSDIMGTERSAGFQRLLRRRRFVPSGTLFRKVVER